MAFSSDPKLLAALMDAVGSSMAWSVHTFIRRSGGRFVFMAEIFTRSFVTTTISEIRRLIKRKTSKLLDEWNGCPECFSFSGALEIFRQHLLIRKVFLFLRKSP